MEAGSRARGRQVPDVTADERAGHGRGRRLLWVVLGLGAFLTLLALLAQFLLASLATSAPAAGPMPRGHPPEPGVEQVRSPAGLAS